MKITVREIFAIDKFQGAYVQAGAGGLDNQISYSTIMDVPYIIDWIKEGVLLMGGLLFRQCISQEFISALGRKGVAGLVTKVQFLDVFTPELVELCNELNLPLIIVSADSTWGEMIYALQEELMQRQYRVIEDTLAFHDMLMHAMIENNEVSAILQIVREALDMDAAVINEDLAMLVGTDGTAWQKYLPNIVRNNLLHQELGLTHLVERDPSPGDSGETEEDASPYKRAVAFPILQENTRLGFLLLLFDAGRKGLDTGELLKLQQAVLMISIAILQQNNIVEATRKYDGLMLEQILNNQIVTQEDCALLAKRLGKLLAPRYYLICISPASEGLRSGVTPVLHNQRTNSLFLDLSKKLPRSQETLVFEKGSNVVLFIPEMDRRELRQVLDTVAREYERHIVTKACMGVSGLTVITAAKQAYQQASQAMAIAQRGKGKEAVLYDDLGILRYFIDHDDQVNLDYLREMRRRFVLPIRAYDEKTGSALLETLDVFISNNCSFAPTAKVLYIHKNTLRQRLQTIKKLTGADPVRIEDLFQLQLALAADFYFTTGTI